MDFTSIIAPIFTATAILAICIGIITAAIKTATSKLTKPSFLYNDVFLPALPYMTAITLYIIAEITYPKTLPGYQCLLGAASSSYFYRLYRAYLKKATQDLGADD